MRVVEGLAFVGWQRDPDRALVFSRFSFLAPLFMYRVEVSLAEVTPLPERLCATGEAPLLKRGGRFLPGCHALGRFESSR